MEPQEKKWPLNEPKNIIIRMPTWLGDLVMATPILEDVRKKWPEATITAMCASHVAPLLKYDPNVDEILTFKKPKGWIHRWHHFEVISTLRYGKYDLGILLTSTFSSYWWFWQGKVSNRIGFKGTLSNGLIFANWLLNKGVSLPKNKENQHQVKTYKALLEPLGIPISATYPRLYLEPEERLAAKERLTLQGCNPAEKIVIGINPGAAYGSAKCWLPDRFRAVIRKLLENPSVAIVCFGDNKGALLLDEICQGLGPRVLNYAGKTSIRELMALLSECSVILTNDSGPMHIAAALDIPLVALFGSTSDIKTGPSPSGVVINKHANCSPCYKRECPIDFRCMTHIEVQEVYQAIMKIIEEKQSRE